ncbi:MAG: flagellar basal body rod protein FlgB [Parahaliea sp.]
MSFTDRIFDASSQALTLRAQRTKLLAANIANTDTPGYKARDIDFAAAIQKESDALGLRLTSTNQRHIDSSGLGAGEAAAKYRVPLQSSVDGNTVETWREQKAFMDNALRYQASLSFLDSRIKSVRSALRGE